MAERNEEFDMAFLDTVTYVSVSLVTRDHLRGPSRDFLNFLITVDVLLKQDSFIVLIVFRYFYSFRRHLPPLKVNKIIAHRVFSSLVTCNDVKCMQ